MIFELCLFAIAVAVVVTLFLLQIDPAESDAVTNEEEVSRPRWERLLNYKARSLDTQTVVCSQSPMISREVILAMAQRGIHTVDIKVTDEDERWARVMLAKSCDRLNAYHPKIEAFERLANAICSQIEKLVNENHVCN